MLSLIRKKDFGDMTVLSTKIEGVKVLIPKVFGDNRGAFLEIWNEKTYQDIGLPDEFVQDNISTSIKGVLRGVHTQLKYPQSKVVSCLSGCIYDVAVDCRIDSPTFGQWYGEILSAENRRMLYIPDGVAHGFYTMEDAIVLMKVTTHYMPGDEIGFMWNDITVGIEWPLFEGLEPVLAEKDQRWSCFDEMMKIISQYR